MNKEIQDILDRLKVVDLAIDDLPQTLETLESNKYDLLVLLHTTILRLAVPYRDHKEAHP